MKKLLFKKHANRIIIGFILFSAMIFSMRKSKLFLNQATFARPFFTFADFCSRVNPDGYVNIYGNYSVGQEITLKFNHLCRIGFLINTEEKAGNARLFLHIKESPGAKEDILTLTAKSFDLSNNYYPFVLPELNVRSGVSAFFFQFKPLEYPIGKKIYVLLESADSNRENGIKIGYYNNRYDRGFVGGESYLNNIAWDRYLAFSTYHWWDGNIFEVFKQITGKIVQDRGFIVFYFTLCSALAIAINAVNHRQRLLKQ